MGNANLANSIGIYWVFLAALIVDLLREPVIDLELASLGVCSMYISGTNPNFFSSSLIDVKVYN